MILSSVGFSAESLPAMCVQIDETQDMFCAVILENGESYRSEECLQYFLVVSDNSRHPSELSDGKTIFGDIMAIVWSYMAILLCYC